MYFQRVPLTLLLLSVLLLSFSACTIKKRRHSSGFHIDFSLSRTQHSRKSGAKINPVKLPTTDKKVIDSNASTPAFSASLEQEKPVAANPVQAIKNSRPTPKTDTSKTKDQPAVEKSQHNTTPVKKTPQLSVKRKIALVTGFSLLLMAVVAAITVPALSGLFVLGNPVLTALNVSNNYGRYMGAFIGWIVILLLDLLASFGIYRYYKKERPKMATLTGALRLIYSVILGIGVFQLLRISASTPAAAIYSGISTFHHFWGLGLIVFGFHLIALGILYKNEGGKKWITITIKSLLIIAGIGYIIQYVGMLLVPNPASFAAIIEPIFIVPMVLGEICFALWKILKGGKKESVKE